jgi:hypothetical protein
MKNESEETPTLIKVRKRKGLRKEIQKECLEVRDKPKRGSEPGSQGKCFKTIFQEGPKPEKSQ